VDSNILVDLIPPMTLANSLIIAAAALLVLGVIGMVLLLCAGSFSSPITLRWRR
jgi:hypothetical protein